jgi:putative membrane protein
MLVGVMWHGDVGALFLLGMIGNLLFWALIIVGVVFLVRRLGGSPPPPPPPPPPVLPLPPMPGRDPFQILAERYARGEIDHDEYQRRVQVLRDFPPNRPPAG